MQDKNIDTLIRGSTMKGRSSRNLKWGEIAVEQRIIEPHFRQEETLHQHYLLLWGDKPTLVDRAYHGGKFTRLVKQPGTLSMGAAGILPAVHAHSPYDVIACVLSPEFVDLCSLEADLGQTAKLHEHLGITDVPLSTLLRLAVREAQDEGVTGRLYSDSLVQAITSRFISVASERPLPPMVRGGLPPFILRRVIDKIASDFGSNLSLAELALESGYSRAHFLRMFRASTGVTPHQYLMRARLEFVKTQLTNDSTDLSEIASASGFSSHSHLTKVFHEQFGKTPSAYRSKK